MKFYHFLNQNKRFAIAVLAVSGLSLSLSACQRSGGSGQALEDIANDPNVVAQQQAVSGAVLQGYCPTLDLLEPYFEEYQKGKKGDGDALKHQASLQEAARGCRIEGNELVLSVGARGRVITGPIGQAGEVFLPIRVVVQRGVEVIFSELYQQPVTVSTNGPSFFQFVQEVRVPAPTKKNYKALIGFDSGPPTDKNGKVLR